MLSCNNPTFAHGVGGDVDVEDDDETSSESLPKTPRVLTTITSLVAFTSSIFTLIDNLYWTTVKISCFLLGGITWIYRDYMDIYVYYTQQW